MWRAEEPPAGRGAAAVAAAAAGELCWFQTGALCRHEGDLVDQSEVY